MDTPRTGFQETIRPVGAGELPASLGNHVLEACATPMIIFEGQVSGCLVRYVNPAFARRTGYSATEIADVGWDGLHMDGGREQGMARLCAAIRERREIEISVRVYSRDGVIFSAALHVSPVGAPGAGRASYAVGVLREQNADSDYVSRLEHDAHYDPLTGLPNRRLLMERAERALARALRAGELVGVALIDLDGFKLVNDTLGHAAGDELLCAVGARLARDVRPGDLIARVGGDEFVLLLKEPITDFSLAGVIERVRRRIEQPFQLHGQPVAVACSIGVAVYPTDGEDLTALLEQADRAMYGQKASRRSKQSLNRFVDALLVGSNRA